jgi:Flp pilus assembly protein TadD
MSISAEEWVQIGRDKHNSGLLKDAIIAFDHAIQIDPNNLEAYLIRSTSKIFLNEWNAAIADLDRAIEINPNEADAYYNRGASKAHLGFQNEAIADFDQAIRVDPNQDMAYYSRGKAKYVLGYKEEAIDDFDHAILINPEYAESYLHRGLIELELGELEPAISDLDYSIILDPDDSYAYNTRGLAKLQLNDKASALTDYNRAISLNPKVPIFYMNRCSLYFNTGDTYSGILDLNHFLSITDRETFFRVVPYVLGVFRIYPAPFLTVRIFQKFTNEFEHFNIVNPILDTTRQQCRHWKRWMEWRQVSGSQNQNLLAWYHALAIVNHYMGDSIEAYRIYKEILADEATMGEALNLMGFYYYIESAKLFRQEHKSLLEGAIKQIEETKAELISYNALRELYYAGQILWANDLVSEAHEYFELADEYLPAAYMQILTLPMTGADEEDIFNKIEDIREREAQLQPGEGFLEGFPERPFQLDKKGNDFLAPILHYAHYREIAEAIAEAQDTDQSFFPNDIWNGFYWLPEDEKEIEWLLRRERLAEMNKSLLEKFKSNVRSGTGIHDLEDLEAAFARKLKHDLWEGTKYLNFEDFKSKSESWPNAAREVAMLVRDSKKLDENDKLLLVEYCHLRDSLSIEDTFFLYFYITYVNTSGYTRMADEAGSGAVKKIFELVFEPDSMSGKVLSAATGDAMARLFKLFLSGLWKENHINMDEFKRIGTRPSPSDDFDVFQSNFLRFIGYEREKLGTKAFEKQYPLQGFDDRKLK